MKLLKNQIYFQWKTLIPPHAFGFRSKSKTNLTFQANLLLICMQLRHHKFSLDWFHVSIRLYGSDCLPCYTKLSLLVERLQSTMGILCSDISALRCVWMLSLIQLIRLFFFLFVQFRVKIYYGISEFHVGQKL